MIINVRTYADFKLAANTLRRLDAVFYNDSVEIEGNPYGVAYAFDYQSRTAVAVQVRGGITFSTTDFPSAISLGDHALLSDASAFADTF